MAKKERTSLYSITFRDPREGNIQTLKARRIEDSSLGLSFIAISEFVFETDSLVVNPHEEALSLRFEDVKTLHLSIYNIIAIEERGAEKRPLQFKKDKSDLKVIKADFEGPLS